ncbi:hypothetical protein DM02DRAFT_658025 [Periconia macrospinosa]|uniref:Uncharacterized protein n=1 Tax=Periconia macrospinosa TaxID=97972 RepID=A0A2V1DKC1_9PLEO|nr:hypothetical protein DM02DRAFT_658025 [Periconia macrospinosa]
MLRLAKHGFLNCPLRQQKITPALEDPETVFERSGVYSPPLGMVCTPTIPENCNSMGWEHRHWFSVETPEKMSRDPGVKGFNSAEEGIADIAIRRVQDFNRLRSVRTKIDLDTTSAIGVGCLPTVYFPLPGALPEDERRPSESRLAFIDVAQQVTHSIKATLKHSQSSGPNLVSIGLDGFACSPTRMLDFLEDIRKPFAFVLSMRPRELTPFGTPNSYTESGGFLRLRNEELLAELRRWDDQSSDDSRDKPVKRDRNPAIARRRRNSGSNA